MRASFAVLPFAVLLGSFLNPWRAIADDGKVPRPPRFEGSLEPKLPKKPLAGVVVEGNSQIKTEQILTLIKTKTGQVPNVRQVREDVSALLSQRWFFDADLMPADATRELFVNSLRELKANPAQPVEVVLPGLLDRVWAEFLSAKFLASLRHFVADALMLREQLRYENQVRPASAQESKPERSIEHSRGLARPFP